MSIITKPSSIVKGVEASITLNKVDLASVVASMGTDAYYEDSSNWSKVILQYGSSTGNQKEIVSFDATQSSPTSTFLVSDKALDIFEVHKIIIVDFDGGVFSIPRSELVTAEFDIDMTPLPSFYVFDSFTTGMDQDINGYLYKSTGPDGAPQAGSSTSVGVLNGSFTVDFELKDFESGSIVWLLFASSPLVTSGFSFGLSIADNGGVYFKQATGNEDLVTTVNFNGNSTDTLTLSISAGVAQIRRGLSVVNNVPLAIVDSTILYPRVTTVLGGPYDNIADGKNLVKVLFA